MLLSLLSDHWTDRPVIEARSLLSGVVAIADGRIGLRRFVVHVGDFGIIRIHRVTLRLIEHVYRTLGILSDDSEGAKEHGSRSKYAEAYFGERSMRPAGFMPEDRSSLTVGHGKIHIG
jgi:hypothetical protein